MQMAEEAKSSFCQNASNFTISEQLALTIVCHKIISKIVTNRTKPLLDEIIAPSQTTFFEGQWMNENVLIAEEMMHAKNIS